MAPAPAAIIGYLDIELITSKVLQHQGKRRGCRQASWSGRMAQAGPVQGSWQCMSFRHRVPVCPDALRWAASSISPHPPTTPPPMKKAAMAFTATANALVPIATCLFEELISLLTVHS